jgi:quinol monooxygenase YgiN
MVVGVGNVAAQQAEQETPNYIGVYVMMHDVDPGDVFEYQEVMAKVVAASKEHETGADYVAYGTMTGGPKDRFYYFCPFETLLDARSLAVPRQILDAVYGPEEGAELLKKLLVLTDGGKSWIVGGAQRMANPPPEGFTGYKPFVYYMEVKIKPGHMNDYRNAVMKMIAAHQKHKDGMHWGASYTNIGGDQGGPEFAFAIGFDKFAELDEWPDMMQVLADEYGEEEAKNIMSTASKYSKSETNFLMLVPELSNWPALEE